MALKKRGVTPKETVVVEEKQVEEKPVIEHEPEMGAEESPPFEADASDIEADEANDVLVKEAKAEKVAKAALEGKPAETRSAPTPETKPTSMVANSQGTSSQKAMAQLAEDGFEDVDISGFGVFPILKLEEGTFLDTDERDYGKEFCCVIMQRRKKWVYKNTKCDKKDETAVYSYDQLTISESDGSTLKDLFAEWAEEGWGWEEKPYLECPSVIRGGEYDGEMVLLSIPPTSRKKFDGHAYLNQMRLGLSPARYVTKCKVGKKVTASVHDFYPWAFSYEGPLTEVEK